MKLYGIARLGVKISLYACRRHIADCCHVEREVKKANRELNSQTAKMDNLQKIDHLTKRCSDLLADMKRHERESLKNKKRGDQLQKEKDQSRTELTKTVGLKEKLEKLCRELQKENNKLKVGCDTPLGHVAFSADDVPFHYSIEREQGLCR